MPLENDRFEFSIFPSEICAQFFNIHDTTVHMKNYPPFVDTHSLPQLAQMLIGGITKKQLSDTIEIDVFIEERDLDDRRVTAAGKMVLRGNIAIIPRQFMDKGTSRE